MKRLAIAVLCLAVTAVPAVEIRLTPDESAFCEAEGGCFIMSQKLLDELRKDAFRRGTRVCEKDA